MIRLIGIVVISLLVAYCSTRPAEHEVPASLASDAYPFTLEQMMRIREAEMTAVRYRILGGDTLLADLQIPDSFSKGTLNDYTRTLVDDNFHVMADEFVTHYTNLIEETDKVKHFNLVINTCYTCHETYCPGPLRQIKALLIEE